MYISISDKCVGCGVCSTINSKIFDFSGDTASVNNDFVDEFEDDCIDAVFACPVNAIRIDEF